MSWDDLRYILAVSRSGTVNDGAKALGVDPTTMSRRLRAMEKQGGTSLFEKLKHGVVLTPAGEEMVTVAEQIERQCNDLDARIKGADARLAGTIRVTATETYVRRWVADFAEYKRQHPQIDLEVRSTTSVANLTQREADVAVRMARQAPEHLIGKKCAELHFAVYGSKELVKRVGDGAPYAAFPWVGWDRAVSYATDDWIAANAAGASIVMRFDQMPVIAAAIEAGLGIGVLPCVMGGSNPNLTRVGDYLEGGLHLWVLTHPELRGSARVMSFMRFVRGLIDRDRDLIEGRTS